ncbi:hypothetical protein C8J57DRAFT_1521605 [Mycena rebaudengoi]|nr:hypothetical protein C8J57DRAFT_1521605 [Mycena rebaudengoi]
MSPPISIVFGNWDNTAPATTSGADPESRELKSVALSGKSWTPSLCGWIRRQQRGESPTKSQWKKLAASNLRRTAMFWHKREALKLRQDRVAHLEALRARGRNPKLPPPIRAPVSPIKARPARLLEKSLETLNDMQEEAVIVLPMPPLRLESAVPVVPGQREYLTEMRLRMLRLGHLSPIPLAVSTGGGRRKLGRGVLLLGLLWAGLRPGRMPWQRMAERGPRSGVKMIVWRCCGGWRGGLERKIISSPSHHGTDMQKRYDIVWSIDVFCDTHTQAALSKTGIMGHNVTQTLLYCYISVGQNARKLLNTLAGSNHLARMVKELTFEGDAYLKIDTTALDAALMKMEFSKKLNVFTIKWHQESWAPVRVFLEHQKGIERLTLWRAVYLAHILEVQPANVLPALRILDACPSDIARLIGCRNLTVMRFRVDETTLDVDSKITDWDVQQLSLAPLEVEYLRVGTVEQLMTLLQFMPWASQAERIALDQDNSWGERIYGVDVIEVDSCIIDVLQHVRELPRLRTFAAVSQEDEEYGILMWKQLQKMEQWVADGEEQWQKVFQILADFVKEEYTPQPIPKLGMQAYWRHVEVSCRAHEQCIKAERAAEWATRADATVLVNVAPGTPAFDAAVDGNPPEIAPSSHMGAGTDTRRDVRRDKGVGDLHRGERFIA